MKPYAMDLRQRVVDACDRREGSRQGIARRPQVSTAWIRGLLQRRRQTGSIAPLPQNAGRKPKLDEGGRRRLARLVEDQPDAPLAQLQEGLGLRGSLAAAGRALRAPRLTLKKSAAGGRAGPARREAPEAAVARAHRRHPGGAVRLL
jgi:transposase